MTVTWNHLVGDIMKSDFQSDVFGGEYVLVEDLGGGEWNAEYAEPSDALIEATKIFYFTPGAYLGYHDPFGPERRTATPQEAFDAEILERIERAGQTFKIRFVSAREWAEAF